jgi:hypothetical protein
MTSSAFLTVTSFPKLSLSLAPTTDPSVTPGPTYKCGSTECCEEKNPAGDQSQGRSSAQLARSLFELDYV